MPIPSLSSIPWLLTAVVAVVLGVFVFLYRADEATIVSLNASIAVQNAAIDNYKKLSDAAKKRLLTAQSASKVQAAKDKKTIDDLLSRPLASPENSCTAADAEILEFIK